MCVYVSFLFFLHYKRGSPFCNQQRLTIRCGQVVKDWFFIEKSYKKYSNLATKSGLFFGAALMGFFPILIWKFHISFWFFWGPWHCPNVSRTPWRQWGFRQCLPFSWTPLRGKHCRDHPIALMVVTFRHGRFWKCRKLNDVMLIKIKSYV